ncbi:MAG TPA: hypothetical protein VEJ18_00320 [Planctomycetota bacterium]|nr:hypothetical protein [Planctomycetota bacterium]
MRAIVLVLLGILVGGSGQAVDPADQARADALAQAGLQDAETLLRAYFPARAFENRPHAWRFWGLDASETVEPTAGFPPEHAGNPSFAVELDGDASNVDPAPRPVRVEGRTLGLSGVRNPGRHAQNGDQYSLKVSDLSGRLHVNDGVDQGPDGSVSRNLQRILNVLGDVVGVQGLGTTILAARPPGGYVSLDELRPLLGDAVYEQVRDYLTAHAWVDPDVANPVPLSGQYAASWESATGVHYERGTPPVFRHGSAVQGVDANNDRIQTPLGLGACPRFGHDSENIKIYGLDVLNPQWIEVVARAPVNVNTASRPVLVALLAGLQGYFVSDRARNNPRWKGDLFLGFKVQNALRPRSPGVPSTGDEVGFLLETLPIVPKTAALAGAEVSAYVLADEILACRERRNSPYFNYAGPSCWFAGPFRTWHQFNAFVDNLARPAAEGGAGVLVDQRSIYFRYMEEVDDPTGHGALVDDPVARRHGVQATADMIKANFNPNLHLNETNPDENLFLRVDKTDLFVNSTEFCFVPTGHFEVQAVGRVLAPAGGATDALAAADNQVKAQSKVSAVFKLYDVKRETTQKHFYAGTPSPRGSGWRTSNNKSIEIGPEPDNGVFPGNLGAAGSPDNEWGGYVALPTIGGLGVDKTPNTQVRTVNVAPTTSLSAAIYVPFALDGDAAFHPFDATEIGSANLADADDSVRNYPDLVGGIPWSAGGPYDPTDGTPGQPVRMARSFRRPGGASPALVPYPPSDLRIDGLQAERHAAPAYLVHRTSGASVESLWNFTGQRASGMVGLWMKPSFFPEITGKVRKVWDMSRYHAPCNQLVFVWPFETLFMPTQYAPDIAELTGPKFWHNNQGQYSPMSFSFGSLQWHNDANQSLGTLAHQFGRMSQALNHLGHPGHVSQKPSLLRAHRWMHMAFAWDLNGLESSGASASLLVNGSTQYSPWTYTTMTGGWSQGRTYMTGFERHSGGEFNQMRFGGTSRIADAAAAVFGYRGNHSPDFTLDEIHVWRTATDADPRSPWMLGRYYRPDPASSEGVFRSAPLGLPAGASRRILGVSWTWLGEPYDPADPWSLPPATDGEPVLYAYGVLGTPAKNVEPTVQLSIEDGALLYGPFSDAGYSPVLNASSQTPVLQDPAQARYLAQFRLLNAQFGDVLLATPVLDDVTLYWSDGASSTLVGATVAETTLPFPPGQAGGGGGSGGGGCGVLGIEVLLLLALVGRRRD